MEFANRRLLLLNEDVPTKHATNKNTSSTSSSPPPETSTTVIESPLQVSIKPVFASSNVAYVFLILFTTFFFIGFVFLYFRQFSTETVSFRRRREEETTSSSAAAKSMMAVVAHEGEKGECPICLEELREGEEVKMIPYCKHVFHPECIDTWLDKHVSCPVCRCRKMCEVSERREEEEEEVVPNLD